MFIITQALQQQQQKYLDSFFLLVSSFKGTPSNANKFSENKKNSLYCYTKYWIESFKIKKSEIILNENVDYIITV